MPPLVIADSVLVAVSGTNQGEGWTNVYGVKLGGPQVIDQGDADAIAAPFRELYNTLKANMTDEFGALSCVVQDVQTITSPSFDALWTPVYGTNTGSNTPPHMAVVASHKTASRGKSYRGRTYLCGIGLSVGITTDGKVAPALITAIQGAFTSLRASIIAIPSLGATHAVASRTLGISTTITNTTVGAEWDSQSRRKRSE